MPALHRCLLLMALSMTIAGVESASYEELAADFGSTPAEVLSLGGTFDKSCTFAFNATPGNCDSLIEAYEEQQGGGECGCYNFCNGQNVGCFPVGETPERFQCDIQQVVAGCQKGVENALYMRKVGKNIGMIELHSGQHGPSRRIVPELGALLVKSRVVFVACPHHKGALAQSIIGVEIL